MGDEPYVFGGTCQGAELARLRALQGVFDPDTRAWLLATGLGAGWRCLEVGAGAGSVATWMSETVGPAGRVLAIDLSARFLAGAGGPNLEVREADIRTARIEPSSFDLAHARFVLIHVPDWKAALAAMIDCLRPGGWLVLEEPDFSCSRPLAGQPELRQAFEKVHQAIDAMFRRGGMDHAFGARLPALFQEGRFEEIAVENNAAIAPGGSPQARMMAMSTCQLKEKYLATGLATGKDIELYAAFAADPTCWATYHATIRALGRKPGQGTV